MNARDKGTIINISGGANVEAKGNKGRKIEKKKVK